MLIFFALLISLVLTLLLEGGFALLVGFRRGHALKYVAIANILTNPAVVLIHYLVYYILPEYVLLITLLLEIMAVIVEWRYYRHYLKESKHPFLFSLTANLFSYFIGCFINILFA